MDDEGDRARRALREIEELIGEAARAGGRVDRWLRELADELRAAIPDAPEPAPAAPPPGPRVDGAGIARRIRSDPARSIGAQGRLDAQALRLLTD